MSHFDELGDLVPIQIWDGVVARVWQGEQAAMTAIELAPGAHVPEHQHPNEQNGVLVRGSATFRIGDETKELKPGAAWVIPGGVPHEVDVGPDGAFIVELFAPPRSDWGSLPRLEPSPPAGF
jgi:quercetin dioxygenase-like cupin family protein